ncbi:hypothetical protein HYU11_03155 [Candidatus Woesearchaeota archaeon]|nr:hypothetical protein [Candidatus Woesearchaeota archaeon]
MGDSRITLPDLEIIYRDVWVMQYLYRVTHYWLMENGWKDAKGNVDHENMEILYLERRGTTFSPQHRELRIWWRLRKQPLFLGGNYYMYHMDIDFNVIQITDVEIMREGQKIKAQHGELRIMIKPYLETELSGAWKDHPILKYVEQYFKARILKRTLEDHKKELYREAYRLQGMMKKYLELKTFLPEVEMFHQKFEYI